MGTQKWPFSSSLSRQFSPVKHVHLLCHQTPELSASCKTEPLYSLAPNAPSPFPVPGQSHPTLYLHESDPSRCCTERNPSISSFPVRAVSVSKVSTGFLHVVACVRFPALLMLNDALSFAHTTFGLSILWSVGTWAAPRFSSRDLMLL